MIAPDGGHARHRRRSTASTLQQGGVLISFLLLMLMLVVKSREVVLMGGEQPLPHVVSDRSAVRSAANSSSAASVISPRLGVSTADGAHASSRARSGHDDSLMPLNRSAGSGPAGDDPPAGGGASGGPTSMFGGFGTPGSASGLADPRQRPPACGPSNVSGSAPAHVAVARRPKAGNVRRRTTTTAASVRPRRQALPVPPVNPCLP
jgi:hypothetical protein